ncbi:hypothetical protein V2W30_02585 [Streptomyces sp. Q6]|uniref:Uncharacterized protein n=1 Tax=Streptomyces citrinus TaxID=3118173 RepID=A0ACD5A579_9ACTN
MESSARRGWLSCEVTWSVEPDALDRVLAGGEAARFLDLAVTGAQTMRVQVTSRAARIDLESATLFGEGVTLVDDGERIHCLGHGRGERLVLDRSWVPRGRCEAPVVVVDGPYVEDCPLEDGRAGKAVSVVLREPGAPERYRQQVFVDPERPAHGLTGRVLELVLGDAGVHRPGGYPIGEVAALVAETGVPVGCAVDALGATPEYVPHRLGGFRIDRWDSGEDDDLTRQPERRAGAPRADVRDAPVVAPASRRDPDTAPVTSRMLPRDEELPGHDPEEVRKPPPPRQTTDAPLGLLIEQRLLSDLTSVVNRALRPLAGASFTFSPRSATVPWLATARQGVLARETDKVNHTFPPGLDILGFCLLHDLVPPSPLGGYAGPSVDVPGWGTIRGRGLLDREAMKAAKAAVTTGTVPAAVLARLPADVTAALTAAGTDWTLLTPEQKLQLAHATLLETSGTLVLPTLPSTLPFNVSDIIVGELSSYTATWGLPRAPDGSCPLITSMTCTGRGIYARLSLGSLALSGNVTRSLGTRYWLVLAASALVPLLMPGLAWVLGVLSSAAAFVVLDAARARLRISGLTADIALRLSPDTGARIQPTITVSCSGRVSADLTSAVPSALHRIVDLVLEALARIGGPVLQILGSTLGRTLTTALRDRVGGSADPATLFGLDVPRTGASVTGGGSSFLYVESQLAAPSGYPVALTTVREAGPSPVLSDASRLVAADGRHYASVLSSENTLNVLLAAAHRRGEFGARLTTGQQGTLRMLTRPPFTPVFSGGVTVAALAPPRLTLQRALPTAPTPHGVLRTEFALTVQDSKETWSRLLFTATAPARVVAGSAPGSTTPKIDLLSMAVAPLDVLVDQAGTTVQVTRVQAVDLVRQTITEEVEDVRGKKKTKTWVETYEREIDQALTASEAQALAPLAVTAARYGFGGVRGLGRLPYRDGVRADGAFVDPKDPAAGIDPVTRLTYTLTGTDPDDLPNPRPGYALADLGFRDGLAFHHLSLAGLAATAVDPTLEQLLVANWAALFYGALGAPDFT